MTRLARLLRPKSIAVFGGQPAARVIEQCDRMGFSGAIWPVHPTRESIHGRACFRAIADLPEPPDAAFIGVNRHAALEVVGQLAARGAGGAVIYASGFLEAEVEIGDGARLQAALIHAAGAMPVLGPNCYGLINALDAAPIWPDQHGLTPVGRGVALVTQSSNIAINLSMQRRGLPIAYLLTAGNQAQTGLSQLGLGALEDPRVTALGLHLEGLDDRYELERLALRARELRKPVVALAVGRSEGARAAAMSHTASLSGGDRALSALLARLGIARVQSLPELLETLKLLHVHGPLDGAELCSMSCSGGEAGLMADAAMGRRVRFRPLTPSHRARVKATLPSMVTVSNPLDYHTFIWADRPAMTNSFAAMMAGGFDLSLLVLDFPRPDRCDDAEWDIAVDALSDAAAETGAKAAVVATLPDCLPEERAADIAARGLAPLAGLSESMAAIDAAIEIGAAWKTPTSPLLSKPLKTGPLDTGPARLLDEAEAKARLAGFGLPIPEGAVADSAEAAARGAALLGFPVALKALGVAHKTEAGAVALALETEAAVLEAAARMAGIDRADHRFLVERMAPKPLAELLIGATRDPAAGLVLTIAAGGVLAELLDDSATLTLPVDAATIHAALKTLRLYRLLQGWRSGPPADLDAAVQAVLAVARFAEANADALEELDVNPLLLYPRGAIAVDALIRIRGDRT